MSQIPEIRITRLNQKPVNRAGSWVLYWMTTARRTSYNYGLEHAAEVAARLNKPLIILEALRLDYPFASPRLHAFILQGMADNARSLAKSPALYLPYVEQKPNEGKGLLKALATGSSLVVCDEFPCFFIPRMLKAAAKAIPVRLESVDSCGLIPLALTEKPYGQAVHFRRFAQKHMSDCLSQPPKERPLAGLKLPRLKAPPTEIVGTWPLAGEALLKADSRALASLPLKGSAARVNKKGGSRAARATLRRFINQGLPSYLERNQPGAEAESGLSPYLHFGHISAHEVFSRVSRAVGWHPGNTALKASGKREGWWGARTVAEAFFDQLITWREIGYHFCRQRPDYAEYNSLPNWARETLAGHAGDLRPYTYEIDTLARARTHDPLWNAAQTQLLKEGTIHNYLRMLWGKKILEWSPGPQEALSVMLELNNRLALDGRDPNSYSGIFWCLGRFDRPWPERPVFGKVRYMSSDSARKKLDLSQYLEKYAP